MGNTRSNYTAYTTPQFRILSDSQLGDIYSAALEVLERTGIEVFEEEAFDLLAGAGCRIDDKKRVRIPSYLVEDALKSAPKRIMLSSRNGQRKVLLEGSRVYYGTGSDCPYILDFDTGERRMTVKADVERTARLCDALPNIDWVMPMGSSQDVPALAADVHEFEAVVTNTTKPIVFIGYSPRGVELVYEMAAEVAGGLENLQQRPFLLAYPEPISPLVIPAEVVDRMFVAADLRMPQIPGPSVQPGATGPVTLAGTVTQMIAEGLMGLVLVQLRRPGAPCCLSANVGVFDMRTSVMSIAAPEISLGLAAQAEVAQSFGLPTWGLAGATDSKTLDAQAGIESAFGILAQGLAGLNMIHDVGYMDWGMVCSAEMLVMGDEVIGMAKRFIQGIVVNAETLARDVIEKVGPGGHYLQEDHTYRHFRKELWMPSLLTRDPYENWLVAGAKDMAQRVHDKTLEIVESHQAPPLPDKTLAALEQLKRRGEEELTNG